MSKAFDLSGVGQKGHDSGNRSMPVLDSEQRSSHDRAAKLSEIHELDSSDQADATGDLGKRTRSSDDVRDADRANFADGTYRVEQHNENTRDTKSGAPSGNGGGF
jgi:hypothetical protein